jgi:hypothetical protein
VQAEAGTIVSATVTAATVVVSAMTSSVSITVSAPSSVSVSMPEGSSGVCAGQGDVMEVELGLEHMHLGPNQAIPASTGTAPLDTDTASGAVVIAASAVAVGSAVLR